MSNNITIGIEGLVGSGKTSLCRELLGIVPNSVLLHGGNLYRAIVYALLQENKNIILLKFKMKKIDIYELMKKYKVEIKMENRESVIYIDGVKADEDALQSKASSLAVSFVGGLADNTGLFEFARKYIEELKKDSNVIISGRALMEIYPELDYHIFITASLKERVNRKCTQYNDKKHINSVKRNIVLRDKMQKMAGFYKRYSITTDIDVTECKSANESAIKVYNYIKGEK